MKTFCFTVDDNIRFFKEITKNKVDSIFDHPYLAVYKRLHDKFGIKVQLNLFYNDEEFDLSSMTTCYYDEWVKNADWLKMSFHSKYENVKPYEFSGYDEVFTDCKKVNDNIIRFASSKCLAKTTTIHYCLATNDGLSAVIDNGVLGLLGLFGTNDTPRTSYGLSLDKASVIRDGNFIKDGNLTFGAIDIVLNSFTIDDILQKLSDKSVDRRHINVMIHEQYFYKDYFMYQPEFEEKLYKTFNYLTANGYNSKFFEELL
jgi:hypothetical protein